AGPARHGVRQVPQGAAQRGGDGEPLQPRPRFRAPAPVQQGRERVPLHGHLRRQVPRHPGAPEPRQAAFGDDHPRRVGRRAHHSVLRPEKLMPTVERVADALSYAHAMGIVNRDIKPANTMYEPESDTVKVTDFGIARITDSSKTKTGMVLGTPSYMSPEQLAGKKVEGRSDLFSLAVSLYQMLSGKLPFEGESMAQLMFKIANEPPTPITSVN